MSINARLDSRLAIIIHEEDGRQLAKYFAVERCFRPFCRRRFVSLSVHFAEFLSRKKRQKYGGERERRASDISMQKHLAASILAAYFPAAFESSPLVSNVSSLSSPRLVVSFLFLAANNRRVSHRARRRREKRGNLTILSLRSWIDLAGISGSTFPFACCTWQANYDKSSTACVNPTIEWLS